MIKQLIQSDKLEQFLQQLLKRKPCYDKDKLVFCAECKNLCKEYKQWHNLLTKSFAEMETK